MSQRVCVIDMPGLSRSLLPAIPGDSLLGQWIAGRKIRGLTPTFPALTCSVQASLTTGKSPAEHGIIANGLPTFRSPADQELVDASNFAVYRKQISFWEQSNQFLEAPRFWQTAGGQSKYKTALLFFQNSMPGFSGALRPAADIVLTPKPDHGPDGKLLSLCWSEPADLVAKLFGQFGPFPLMNYWGPMAGIAASQWIAKAAAWIWEHHQPHLQWVYIPHLDYDLQRFGPSSVQAKKAVADAAAAAEPLIAAVLDGGGKIVLLSEYSLRDVTACAFPNVLLANAGLLKTHETADGNLIDYERSEAIAMVDHQIAHVYCRDGRARQKAREVLPVDANITVAEPAALGMTHRRAGDLILQAAPHAWLNYRWWTDPSDAPPFSKTVDIHRKPGYDPLELFWDRSINSVAQDSALLHGSHGLINGTEAVLVCDSPDSTDVHAAEAGAMIERLLV